MTGFNDFFFAIGILLLGFGMAFFTGGEPVPSLVAVIVVWGLSELLVRRMRLVLPGILLALFFIFFVFLIVPTDLSYFTDQRPPSAATAKRLSVSRGGIWRPGTCRREQSAARHCRRGALLLAVPAAVCAAADRRQPGHCRDLIDRARGRAAQPDLALADDPRLRRRSVSSSPCHSTCRIATA